MRTFVNIRPTVHGPIRVTQPTSLSELRQIEDSLGRLFGLTSSEAKPNLEVNNELNRHPIALDIQQTANSLLITASIPGVAPDSVDIEIENGVLSIRAERPSEPLEEGAAHIRKEIRAGLLGRTIELPENIDAQATVAEFQNGLVSITIPRVAEVKPQPLRIPVRSTSLTSAEVTNSLPVEATEPSV